MPELICEHGKKYQECPFHAADTSKGTTHRRNTEPKSKLRPAALEPVESIQKLRDVFNKNGLNYSQIVGDELTVVSMELQDFNWALNEISRLLVQAKLEGGERVLDDIYKFIPVTFSGNPDFVERSQEGWREVVANIAAFVSDYDMAALQSQLEGAA